MTDRKCRCHVALFIFTYVDEDGAERCIGCDRIIKAAPVKVTHD